LCQLPAALSRMGMSRLPSDLANYLSSAQPTQI